LMKMAHLAFFSLSTKYLSLIAAVIVLIQRFLRL